MTPRSKSISGSSGLATGGRRQGRGCRILYAVSGAVLPFCWDGTIGRGYILLFIRLALKTLIQHDSQQIPPKRNERHRRRVKEWTGEGKIDSPREILPLPWYLGAGLLFLLLLDGNRRGGVLLGFRHNRGRLSRLPTASRVCRVHHSHGIADTARILKPTSPCVSPSWRIVARCDFQLFNPATTFDFTSCTSLLIRIPNRGTGLPFLRRWPGLSCSLALLRGINHSSAFEAL